MKSSSSVKRALPNTDVAHVGVGLHYFLGTGDQASKMQLRIRQGAGMRRQRIGGLNDRSGNVIIALWRRRRWSKRDEWLAKAPGG